jgi:hypothetical protein
MPPAWAAVAAVPGAQGVGEGRRCGVFEGAAGAASSEVVADGGRAESSARQRWQTVPDPVDAGEEAGRGSRRPPRPVVV